MAQRDERVRIPGGVIPLGQRRVVKPLGGRRRRGGFNGQNFSGRSNPTSPLDLLLAGTRGQQQSQRFATVSQSAEAERERQHQRELSRDAQSVQTRGQDVGLFSALALQGEARPPGLLDRILNRGGTAARDPSEDISLPSARPNVDVTFGTRQGVPAPRRRAPGGGPLTADRQLQLREGVRVGTEFEGEDIRRLNERLINQDLQAAGRVRSANAAREAAGTPQTIPLPLPGGSSFEFPLHGPLTPEQAEQFADAANARPETQRDPVTGELFDPRVGPSRPGGLGPPSLFRNVTTAQADPNLPSIETREPVFVGPADRPPERVTDQGFSFPDVQQLLRQRNRLGDPEAPTPIVPQGAAAGQVSAPVRPSPVAAATPDPFDLRGTTTPQAGALPSRPTRTPEQLADIDRLANQPVRAPQVPPTGIVPPTRPGAGGGLGLEGVDPNASPAEQQRARERDQHRLLVDASLREKRAEQTTTDAAATALAKTGFTVDAEDISRKLSGLSTTGSLSSGIITQDDLDTLQEVAVDVRHLTVPGMSHSGRRALGESLAENEDLMSALRDATKSTAFLQRLFGGGDRVVANAIGLSTRKQATERLSKYRAMAQLVLDKIRDLRTSTARK